MALSTRLRNSFVAGLVLLAPLVVTLFVLRLLVNWLLQFVDPLVQTVGLAAYTANEELAAQVLATVLIFGAVLLVGYLAQYRSGQRLFGGLGRVVAFVPVVNVVYRSVRQVADALVDRDSRYESVVLVEYPRDGLYAIGLVTGDAPPEVDPVVGPGSHLVYLPHSPNPTAGNLVVVPDERIEEIDVSVRRGLRLLVTTGIAEDEAAMLRDLDGAGDADQDALS